MSTFSEPLSFRRKFTSMNLEVEGISDNNHLPPQFNSSAIKPYLDDDKINSCMESDSEGICIVCTVNLVDVEIGPCRHQFCDGCLSSWRQTFLAKKQAASCPYCRSNIDSVKSITTSNIDDGGLSNQSHPKPRIVRSAWGKSGVLPSYTRARKVPLKTVVAPVKRNSQSQKKPRPMSSSQKTFEFGSLEKMLKFIGPGGATIQRIQDETGATYSIDRKTFIATITGTDTAVQAAHTKATEFLQRFASYIPFHSLTARERGTVIGTSGCNIKRIMRETGTL